MALDDKIANKTAGVAVIGLGAWGREILNTLARLPEAEIAALCDTYSAAIRRGAEIRHAAENVPDVDDRARRLQRDVVARLVHEQGVHLEIVRPPAQRRLRLREEIRLV